MTKRTLTLATLAVCVGVIGFAFATQSRADNEGFNWQAYDTITRSSPGGWMSYRLDAERNACTQKKAYPNHVVQIKRMRSTEQFSQAIVFVPNYSC